MCHSTPILSKTDSAVTRTSLNRIVTSRKVYGTSFLQRKTLGNGPLGQKTTWFRKWKELSQAKTNAGTSQRRKESYLYTNACKSVWADVLAHVPYDVFLWLYIDKRQQPLGLEWRSCCHGIALATSNKGRPLRINRSSTSKMLCRYDRSGPQLRGIVATKGGSIGCQAQKVKLHLHEHQGHR